MISIKYQRSIHGMWHACLVDVNTKYVVWEGTSPGSCAYYFKLISNSSVGNWNIRFEVIIFLP
jgi:hypothetical protein